MDNQISMRGIYIINPLFNEKNNIIIYGADQGAIYLYQELKKRDISIIGFYAKSVSYQCEICGLPIISKDDVECLENAQIILSQYSKSALDDIRNINIKYAFIYSTAYQEDIIWDEIHMEDILVLPFYKLTSELMKGDIVLYGTGDIGHRLFMELLNYEIPVKYFCDTNKSVVGLRLMNKPVISLEKLIEIKENCNVIIASRDYADEIGNTLWKYDVRNIYYYNG